MAKEAVVQMSFSAGELSPHLHDRIDLEAYYNSAAEMENFIPLPHGPLVRRRGSTFVGQGLSSDIRLVPFTFNILASFVVEFTPGKIRILYKDGFVKNTSNAILSITTDIRAEDLPNLNWAQFGDWLYVTDGYHTPKALKRYGNQDWRWETLSITSAPTEWSGTNQPKFITFYEQRAFYAGTALQPQQIWASRTGIYEDFTYKDEAPNADTDAGEDEFIVLDDHAFTYTLFSNDANGIEWIQSMGTLVIGTAGAEYKVSASSVVEPITPKNIKVTVQTHYGSASIRPVTIGSNIIFVQRSLNRVRAFEYSFAEDQYAANDITMFAAHILDGRAKEMSVQTAPDSYIWLVTYSGHLIGCTYEKNQKVIAWHRHTMDGKIKSLAVLPQKGNDILYVAVERIINGTTKTYIEMLVDMWESTDVLMEAPYLDSHLTYEGTPADDFSGLSHLEGMTVGVQADGWIHPDCTVTNGAIHLQEECAHVIIGLKYKSYLKSVIPQSSNSMSIGSPRRIVSATLALENTADFYYKDASTTKADLCYNGPVAVMNSQIELTSRHQDISVEGPTSSTSQLEVWQERPLPLIIRGIVYYITPSSL